MSANITPFNSDGGFTTAGNITGGTANLVAINGPSDAFFDIKVTDSGPGASLQLGDWDIAGFPKSLVQVSDNVHIVTGVTTGGGDWNFDTNGDVTVPGDILAQEGNDLAVQVFNPTAEGGVTYVVQNRQVDLDYARTTQFEVAPANIILSTDFSGNRYQWFFDNTGNLVLPDAANASINYANGNPYGGSGGGATNLIANGNSYANIATADGNLVVNVGTDGYGTWIFETGTGNLIGPGNISQGAGIVFSADQSVYIREDMGQLNIDAGSHTVITSNSGNVGNTQSWNFDNTGNLTAPGNISTVGSVTADNFSTTGIGGDIAMSGGNITGASRVITTPTALANLTAVAGGRAFVNNGNLVAAGNFGAQIGSGGSNVVPVWSDGTNWYIG